MRSHVAALVLALPAVGLAACTALLGDGQYYVVEDGGHEGSTSSSGADVSTESGAGDGTVLEASPDSGAPIEAGGQDSMAIEAGSHGEAGEDSTAGDSGFADSPATGEGASDSGIADSTAEAEADAAPESGTDATSPIDSGQDAVPPADSGSCTSTAALLATGTSSVASAHFAAGQWSAATPFAQGSATPPGLVPFAGGFLGAFAASSTSFLEWTGYTSTWSSPAQIAAALAQGTPALAAAGSTGHVVYMGTDSKFYHDTYIGSWGGAPDAVEPDGGAQSFGGSPPAAAAVGATLVVAQAGSNGVLYDQSWSGGAWQAANAHAGSAVVTTISPAMVAMNGGSADLMIVFVHQTDFNLQYTTRTAGVWSTPVDVYDQSGNAAYSSSAPSLAALPNGGAIVAWEGGSPTYPYASTYLPATGWTVPAAIASTPLSTPPSLAPGLCGATALAAFVPTTGQVDVATLTGGAWSIPVAIAGATGMTGVALAATP